MKKTIFIFGILGISLFCSLINEEGFAQETKQTRARIDISSEGMRFGFAAIKSNGSFVSVGKNENQTKAWIARMNLKDKESQAENYKWQELWIEFVPEGSGIVYSIFKGGVYPDLKVNHHEIWVDDVTVEGEGAEIKNGSFEEQDSKGNPLYWQWFNPLLGEYSIDGSQSRNGKSCLLVWVDSYVSQKIIVKAGRKYKVSAWFKPN